MSYPNDNLTFKQFSRMNLTRCESPEGFNHAIGSWTTSDWLTAVVGELGEAANVIKKLNRVRDNIPGNDIGPHALRNQLAHEIADTFIYLDLLAQSLGFELDEIVQDKFRITSTKIGYKSK